MSSTERNKVKSFGDPSIAHGEMADRFLIVGAFNAPPLLQIGLNRNVNSEFSKENKKLQSLPPGDEFMHQTNVIFLHSIELSISKITEKQ